MSTTRSTDRSTEAGAARSFSAESRIDPLIAAVHGALNETAIRRRPPATLLPPESSGISRAMPTPARPERSVADALAQRRSGYRFHPGQVQASHLAAIVRHGICTAPRAGGLASVVASVVVCTEGDLPTGVHRVEHRWPTPGFAEVRRGDPRPFVAGSLEQEGFASRVSAWLALAIDLRVGAEKYPSRHYRTLHLDAGAAMQNALVVASTLGLTACPVMGYDDHAWDALLALPEGVVTCGLVALGPRPASAETSQQK